MSWTTALVAICLVIAWERFVAKLLDLIRKNGEKLDQVCRVLDAVESILSSIGTDIAAVGEKLDDLGKKLDDLGDNLGTD
jgi:hypothetical protein